MGIKVQPSSSQISDRVPQPESEGYGNTTPLPAATQTAFTPNTCYGSSEIENALSGLGDLFGSDGIGSGNRATQNFAPLGANGNHNSSLKRLEEQIYSLEQQIDQSVQSQIQNLEQQMQQRGQQFDPSKGFSGASTNNVVGSSRGERAAGANAIGGGGGRSPSSGGVKQQPQPGDINNNLGMTASSASGALGPNVPKALQPFEAAINAASKQTGVPASLIGAQILQESGGNPNAVTTNPALGLPDTGLMQVDQATFQELQKQNPGMLGGKSVSDPATNIMAGALLDAQLL